MAGLFDKQAEVYLDARPTYPSEWFSMLAARTPRHSLAWDVGTGNGQAAVAIAEHYDQVIGTDVSEAQLKHAVLHPKVRYIHTPLISSMGEDELVSLLGGEGSVDLVTVAQAVHWFDLPSFYSLVTRLLRKPGGLLAVWGYNDIAIDPAVDKVMKKINDSANPFWNSNISYLFDGYRTLPFPFESVGMGTEGEPVLLDMHKELSLDGLLGFIRSWSALTTAKERGVDLLTDGVVKELEAEWGEPGLIRRVTYKAFMLVGSPVGQKENNMS